MPATNPFAPVIDVGSSASAGPVTGSASLSVNDHHASAGLVLFGLVVLVLLWKGKWRFSTTVG